ncbi:MAG: alkaline phosphatase family protein [Chitinophagaceae bacterium]|nr:alkaline phosphatase family protein [Chitinophagaceae bacterium]
MKLTITFFLSGWLFIFPGNIKAQAIAAANQGDTKVRTLIVVFDGLRPDYIRQDWMPRLYTFRRNAAFGKDHHSVFPTVTRVNAASYATASYPERHGLMGNNLYLPAVDAGKALNTGDAEQMMAAMQVTSGNLLTSPSLGEVLKQNGEKMFVYSSGSTGQAFLQNHTVNGAIINPDLVLPESFRKELAASIGMPPPGENANGSRHHWIVDALCRYTLAPDGPLVSAIWFSDPDGVAHEHGIGVPQTVQALQIVDREFGRLLDSLKIKGLEDRFNIIVTADHGFVTHTGKQGLSGFLIEKGWKESNSSDDVILAGGAIYVKDHERDRIKKIVASLQKEEWIGAIFTRAAKPGSMKGWVKGTLSFESVHWDHPGRAADILVAVNWNDQVNSMGFAGTDFAGGVAGHGGISRYETHIALMASGPSFRSAYENHLPTSNIDIVPTVLYFQGIGIPVEMEGRILYEMLKEDRDSQSQLQPQKQTLVSEAKYKWGTYKVILERTRLGKYSYINDAKAVRTLK